MSRGQVLCAELLPGRGSAFSGEARRTARASAPCSRAYQLREACHLHITVHHLPAAGLCCRQAPRELGGSGAAQRAGAMAPAVPLGEVRKKANPFVKPSDKANGAASAPPPAKGNPFLVDKAAANGRAGKPPVTPFSRPAAARGAADAAAAVAGPAAALPAARAAAAWAPTTPLGREAKAAADRAAATGAAEAPAALAADLQVCKTVASSVASLLCPCSAIAGDVEAVYARRLHGQGRAAVAGAARPCNSDR